MIRMCLFYIFSIHIACADIGSMSGFDDIENIQEEIKTEMEEITAPITEGEPKDVKKIENAFEQIKEKISAKIKEMRPAGADAEQKIFFAGININVNDKHLVIVIKLTGDDLSKVTKKLKNIIHRILVKTNLINKDVEVKSKDENNIQKSERCEFIVENLKIDENVVYNANEECTKLKEKNKE